MHVLCYKWTNCAIGVIFCRFSPIMTAVNCKTSIFDSYKQLRTSNVVFWHFTTVSRQFFDKFEQLNVNFCKPFSCREQLDLYLTVVSCQNWRLTVQRCQKLLNLSKIDRLQLTSVIFESQQLSNCFTALQAAIPFRFWIDVKISYLYRNILTAIDCQIWQMSTADCQFLTSNNNFWHLWTVKRHFWQLWTIKRQFWQLKTVKCQFWWKFLLTISLESLLKAFTLKYDFK